MSLFQRSRPHRVGLPRTKNFGTAGNFRRADNEQRRSVRGQTWPPDRHDSAGRSQSSATVDDARVPEELFVLKLEFRATPNADSGVFIRKPQLQCRDYPLAGPYKKLQKYRPQDWNELMVTVKDNMAHCECNGEVLEESLAVPPTGPIGLEGDRGQMEYRRIRLSELP